jgi:hypothetical protein
MCGIWSYYNRVSVALARRDPAASWNLTSTTYQQLNQSTANQLNFVQGLSEDAFEAQAQATANINSNAFYCGIGLNSTNTRIGMASETSISGLATTATAKGMPIVGLNYLAALQMVSTGTATAYGGANNIDTGIQATLKY